MSSINCDIQQKSATKGAVNKTTWLRTIDEDIQPQNFGVHTAWRKARDREIWHQGISTATLC